MENSIIDYIVQYVIRILCLTASIIYFRSMVGKVRDIYHFKIVIKDYKVLPNFLVPVVSIGVPAAEIAVGVGLMLGGNSIQFAALFGAILQLCFTFLMLIRLNTIQPHGCGCFGSHSAEKITIKHVLRNFAMLVLFTIIALFPDVSLV
jgi:hypothetical protein